MGAPRDSSAERERAGGVKSLDTVNSIVSKQGATEPMHEDGANQLWVVAFSVWKTNSFQR